jgi:Glutathione S-transferase, C-terminal domain/Glutathione S-transferase, N-terminal domain
MKLTYFDCRGIIETSRCMLKIAGVPFEDHRMKMTPKEGGGWDTPEFVALKGTSDLDANMNRVPILHVDGAVIGQSKSIDRFVAKRCNMLGSSDVEAAQIDCITEHIRDIKDKYSKAKSLPAAEKDAAVKKFFESDLVDHLVLLEKSLPATRTPGHAVGSATSYADVSLWALAADYFDDKAAVAAAVDKCPGLKAIVEAVAELPNLKAWLAVRPVTSF